MKRSHTLENWEKVLRYSSTSSRNTLDQKEAKCHAEVSEPWKNKVTNNLIGPFTNRKVLAKVAFKYSRPLSPRESQTISLYFLWWRFILHLYSFNVSSVASNIWIVQENISQRKSPPRKMTEMIMSKMLRSAMEEVMVVSPPGLVVMMVIMLITARQWWWGGGGGARLFLKKNDTDVRFSRKYPEKWPKQFKRF